MGIKLFFLYFLFFYLFLLNKKLLNFNLLIYFL